jgi:hypothetical protein
MQFVHDATWPARQHRDLLTSSRPPSREISIFFFLIVNRTPIMDVWSALHIKLDTDSREKDSDSGGSWDKWPPRRRITRELGAC